VSGAHEIRFRVRQEIEKAVAEETAQLAAGKAKDHADYMKRVGKIAGMNRVLDELDEQYRVMNQVPV
jgi:hypothetical protein